jgi:ABC-2 type transport system ATP-binding protein
MMVGLMSITKGEILIKGKNIKSEFEESIRHVGAIVENPEMYKFLSGYHNLIHYSRMIPGITKQRINEVVKLVKLENRIHDKVKKYSLGMRQRLGVAQALLHKPSLLILDEPTNGLDPAGIRELRDYLRYLTKEEGTTVIVSSHLLSEMELMCDRVAIIQQGKLVDVKLIQDFIGSNDEAQTFLIEALPAEQAVAAIIEMEGISEVRVVPVGLEIIAKRDLIPQVVARLVQSNVEVYGIRLLRQSLIDWYYDNKDTTDWRSHVTQQITEHEKILNDQEIHELQKPVRGSHHTE